jgi:hypothetical protein
MPSAIDTLTKSMERPGTDAKLWTLILLDAWMRDVDAG